MTKKIYFVRHAESEANAAAIMAGSGHDIPLTDLGKQQAMQAGKDLKSKKIELLVCSPMIRTRQTAEIIAKEIGYNPNKIVFNDLLVERGYGWYEAKPVKIYAEHRHAETLREGIETTEQLLARAQALIKEASKYKEQNILLVSHGSFGRMVKVAVQQRDHSHFHVIDHIGNAEVFEFSL
jgi:uncharacterized phosphatase